MNKRLEKFFPGENTLMVIIASFIGVAAGFANILFRFIEELVHHYIFETGHHFLVGDGGWRLLFLPLIPMFGMLLLIPFAYFYKDEVNGYGFTKFLRKVNLEGGRIPFRTIWLKTVTTSLTIGSGGSAGVEGPIAMVGGAVGSQVGQFFRVSGDRMKVYIAAGCAGGIAAMFNAPIAGVFFAAEIVLLGTYEVSAFSALVISSALASVVSRAVYGEISAFQIPDYNVVSPMIEVPLYMLMGLLVGVVAVFYIKIFYWVRDRFASLALNRYMKPILGAFMVGSIGIGFPQVMGNGYHYISEVLNGDGVIWVMLLLVFAKIISTSITLGSGGAGGVFAPSLFIGAVIGGSFGTIANNIFPGHIASSGAYAAVGIGAFLAAVTHAPLTAIFLLFEMTGNYLIIIPIMLASIIGAVVSAKLYPDSIDTVDFTNEGIDIHDGRETAVLKSIKVGRAMVEDVDFISERATAKDLLKIFSMAENSFYYPVLTESGKQAGQMCGIISMQDVKAILHDEELLQSATVGNIMYRNVITLTPDDDLYTAMSQFMKKGIEEIPVVESLEEPWVVGMLRRRDVLSVYNREVLKRGISGKTASIRLK
ncbi:MAG: chloride channel protein [Desulfobulbaceae bacterium]|uniref:Chloride channel protein n=1 Tax=Candidatus Desulfobia pelagia TaxID=2841692 RepID=A0A8J6TFZ1_9BACT|nr:chloride channel protein [Candidatus Desulfobia pelagia]